MTDSARSVLITGCSSGIGYATALGLKERGYRVFATARKPDDVMRLRGEGLEASLLDVTSSTSIRQCVEHVLETTGGELYGLFNNAGYGQPGAVEDLSRAALREQLETNLLGAHELARTVLPPMRAAGRGRIIQNSSVLGMITLPYRGAYCASKFALEGLTDTLRLELRGSGVHVSIVEPGPIRSAFRENALRAYRQHIDPEASAHRETYAAVERRLTAGGDASFTLPPEAVLKKVVKALEARRPKPRYYVTFPTHLFGFLRRVLPYRTLDRVLLASTADERRTEKT